MVSKRLSKPHALSLTVTLLAACLILCAILLFPFARDVLLHDYALYRYSQDFNQVRHPADTNLVSSKKYLGLISGNGNHCNYFIGELRSYTGDPAQIAAFYAGQGFTGLGNELVFMENGEFPADDLGLLPPADPVLSAWLGSTILHRDHIYLIYTFYIDLNAGLDFRCS